MDKSVKWGWGSIIGYASAAATALTPMIGTLADNAEPLGVPAQTWIIVSAILTAVTTIGRMYQAGKQAGDAFIQTGIIPEPVPVGGGAGEPGEPPLEEVPAPDVPADGQ